MVDAQSFGPRGELVGTWRVEDASAGDDAAADQLLVMSADGRVLHVEGGADAYPATGSQLVAGATRAGWGSWSANADTLGLMLLRDGEQELLELDYTLERGRLVVELGVVNGTKRRRAVTLRRIDREAPTVDFSHGMEMVDTDSDIAFVLPAGWTSVDVPVEGDGLLRSTLSVSGAGTQRLTYAYIAMPEEAAALRAAEHFAEGVIHRTAGEALELETREDSRGCGVRGDVAYRASVPGFAFVESTWTVTLGGVAGVVCSVEASSPDHFDLIPTLAESMYVRGYGIFTEDD